MPRLIKQPKVPICLLVRVALLAGMLLLSAACAGGHKSSNQPAASNSPSANSSGNPVAVSTPTSAANAAPSPVGSAAEVAAFNLNDKASVEFDQIVGRIVAQKEGKSQSDLIGILSEGHARPSRSAVYRSQIGGFSVRSSIRSGRGPCAIAAFSNETVEIEAAADGSKAKTLSPLTGATAKVYCDLSLPRARVTIPKQTLLRRESTGWVAIKQTELEKRLDAIK